MHSHNIETIYPLSPMQQGLLFHSLEEPGIGLYCEQIISSLPADTDLPTFFLAWQHIVKREAVLRTAFVYKNVPEPLQVVRCSVELPIETVDWKHLSEEEAQTHWRSLLRQDRKRGYVFSEAPLARLTVCTLPDGSHRCLFSFHHILLDGWSLSLLYEDLLTTYRMLHQSQLPNLELRPTFQDFVKWHRSQDWPSVEGFWRSYLKGLLTPTALPLGQQNLYLSEDEELFGEVFLESSDSLAAAINSICRNTGFTLNTIIQVAWAILLSRHCGEEDVLFGATVSGRSISMSEVDTTVGLLINTLPVRIKVSQRSSLRHLLLEAQSDWSKRLRYEQTPLSRIQSWSEMPAGTSLFESIIVFENYPQKSSHGLNNEIVFSATPRWLQLTNYPLHLTILPGEAIGIHLTYDRRRITDNAASRLLGQMIRLLESFERGFDAPHSELNLLDREEEEFLLGGCHEVGIPSCPETFMKRWEANVEAMPSGAAVSFRGRIVTLKELDEDSNRLATELSRRDVTTDTVVALLGERNYHFWVSTLAILKAGAAYLPLDPTHPTARNEQILRISKCKMMVVGKDAERLPPMASENILTYPLSDLPGVKDGSWSYDLLPDPNHLAYVIFTSGSTGLPKGAMIPHRSMLNHLDAKIRLLELSQLDVVAQTASQCFDISVWQFFAPLLVGARVHIIEDEIAHDASLMIDEVERAGVTVLEIVPSFFQSVLEELERRGTYFPLRSLRYVISTGETLSPELCRRWYNLAPHIPLINAYGPTECGDDVTHYVQREPQPINAVRVPIGRAISNAQLYILNGDLMLAPFGAPGELYVGGECLGRGYLNDPIRTAEAFIPNPFSFDPGERLYKTGDVVRYLPGGDLEFLGRVDQQIKLRGYRIELEEIEEALRHYPGVMEAVVDVRELGPNTKKLIAYVTIAHEQASTIKDMKNLLRNELPSYSMPHSIVILQSIPRLTNGKIDRHSLPIPIEPTADHLQQEPQTRVELELQRIWREVLSLEYVGIDDNFFELGGDSILSLRIVALARRAGLLIKNKDIFEHQTISSLASVATYDTDEQERISVPEEVLLLTPSQKWFFSGGQPIAHHWNTSVLLEAKERLCADIFQDALMELMNHHDALRLRIRRGAGNDEQVIAREEPSQILTTVDLSELTEPARAARLLDEAGKLQASLNLESGPVFRAALFDMGEGEPQQLLLSANHLAVDGFSLRILVEDLQAAYQHIRRGEPADLPPVPVSYSQWVASVNKLNVSTRSEVEYWTEVIAPPFNSLPTDTVSGANSRSSARLIRRTLSEDETRALRLTTRQVTGTTINDILLASLSMALKDWVGAGAFLIDVEGHGRGGVNDGVLDLSRTVGWLGTIFPIRVQVDSTALSEEEALGIVREVMRRVPAGGQGFNQLRFGLHESDQFEKLATFPGSQIRFNYLGQYDEEFPSTSIFKPSKALIAGPLESSLGDRRYVLEIDMFILSGKLHLLTHYSENQYRQMTIEAFVSRLLNGVKTLTARCGLRRIAQETLNQVQPI